MKSFLNGCGNRLTQLKKKWIDTHLDEIVKYQKKCRTKYQNREDAKNCC